MSSIDELFAMQKTYNQKIFSDDMDINDIERHTQHLALCAHAEISSLISATKYRKHHTHKAGLNPDEHRIVYESVDVIRYIMAILNLWNIDSDRFENAFYRKDIYLNTRKRIDDNPWDGRPVVIVDVDDVIVDFRAGFSKWLNKAYSVAADVHSSSYYFIDDLTDNDLNPERVFLDFVDKGGFFELDPISGAIKFLNDLRDRGYWIHMLTARPSGNLSCFYDTYEWLDRHDIPFDDLSFSAEKFRWCAQSVYYDTDSIVWTLDDSPKHATEYASHGLRCLVPEKPYNMKIWEADKIYSYSDFNSALDRIAKTS